MNGACNSKKWHCPQGPFGSKGQISLNFNNKVNFKDIYANLCVFLQIKDIKHVERDFFNIGSCPRARLWAEGVRRESKIYFFEHGYMAYQIDGDDE